MPTPATGMFLPLLETKAKAQRGMVVEVWTSDDFRFLYEVDEVRRDQRNLDDALDADTRAALAADVRGPARGRRARPRSSPMPLSVEPADHDDAHPKPKPVDCG